MRMLIVSHVLLQYILFTSIPPSSLLIATDGQQFMAISLLLVPFDQKVQEHFQCKATVQPVRYRLAGCDAKVPHLFQGRHPEQP